MQLLLLLWSSGAAARALACATEFLVAKILMFLMSRASHVLSTLVEPVSPNTRRWIVGFSLDTFQISLPCASIMPSSDILLNLFLRILTVAHVATIKSPTNMQFSNSYFQIIENAYNLVMALCGFRKISALFCKFSITPLKKAYPIF